MAEGGSLAEILEENLKSDLKLKEEGKKGLISSLALMHM